MSSRIFVQSISCESHLINSGLVCLPVETLAIYMVLLFPTILFLWGAKLTTVRSHTVTQACTWYLYMYVYVYAVCVCQCGTNAEHEQMLAWPFNVPVFRLYRSFVYVSLMKLEQPKARTVDTPSIYMYNIPTYIVLNVLYLCMEFILVETLKMIRSNNSVYGIVCVSVSARKLASMCTQHLRVLMFQIFDNIARC